MKVKDYLKQKAEEIAKRDSKDMVVKQRKAKETSADRELAKKFYLALASGDRQLLVESNKAVESDFKEKGYDEKYYREKAQTVGTVGTGTSGGILVPTTVATSILSKMKFISPMRQIATVLENMPAKFNMPSEATMAQAYWVAEGVTITESGETFDPNILEPFKLAGLDSFTSEVLEDAVSNPSIQAYVEARFAIAMALKENDAFVNGDGSGKPYGFRSSAITPNGVAQAAAALAYTDLTKLKYSLGTAYRQMAVWVLSSAGVQTLENLKDTAGRPIWREGLTEDTPNKLLGRPAYIVDEIPSNLGTGTNETEIWYGVFGNYFIGDRGALRVDYGTNGSDFANDKITLRMIKRVAGRPALGESFSKLTAVK